MNACPAFPNPPELTNAPIPVPVEDTVEEINVVPPIIALPVIPKPPLRTKEANRVVDAFCTE